jgi:hypothetical protein
MTATGSSTAILENMSGAPAYDSRFFVFNPALKGTRCADSNADSLVGAQFPARSFASEAVSGNEMEETVAPEPNALMLTLLGVACNSGVTRWRRWRSAAALEMAGAGQ